MILNLKSNCKFSDNLFWSIDHVSDSKKVWFKNQPGIGGAGYYLSYYKWDEGEANEVKEGLGLYLGKKYGKTCIYDSFSADHWAAMEEWKWNEKEQKFGCGLWSNLTYRFRIHGLVPEV